MTQEPAQPASGEWRLGDKGLYAFVKVPGRVSIGPLAPDLAAQIVADHQQAQRVDALEAALRKYGKHESACGVEWFGNSGRCTCGLTDALSTQNRRE